MPGWPSCGRRSRDERREVRHRRLPRRPRRRARVRRHLRLQALAARARGDRARRARAPPQGDAVDAGARARGGGRVTEAALLLFWPALAGYAEAAFAYAGDTVRPGRLVRYAIWGVRLGWLAQTVLLVAQAASAEGFPWGTWAGSLNLFVWMCVGVYP